MKLRRLPEDFCVHELAEPDVSGGEFALYRLSKRSLGTPEAVNAVCRYWKIARGAVSVGGLKDRHAVTEQFLTIHRGPRRNLTQQNLGLEYLGQTGRPFESRDIAGNRFRIVLRDLTEAQEAEFGQALHAAERDGLPNYFDDQRFGSLGRSEEFIGAPWCRGDFERALWLAAADENDHDRPRDREEKEVLRKRWGDWSACLPRMRDDLRRQIVSHLVQRPRDFRGAFVRIPAETRRLYLAAFQSELWNRILAETLRSRLPAQTLFEVPIGPTRAVFFRELDSTQRALLHDCQLPLPSSREKLTDEALSNLYEKVAGQFGLATRTLRVKYPRDSFFSRGSRPALFRPAQVSCRGDADEEYPGQRKLVLQFDLPRGSYATIVVKRISMA